MEEGIIKIERECFLLCNSAKAIVLPDSLESLEHSSFMSLSKLESLKIGKNLSYIAKEAFAWFNGSPKVEIDAQNPNFTAENNAIYNKNKTILLVVVPKNIDKFEIPIGVKEISTAFYNRSKMNNVIIPNTVTKIGTNAFNGCTNLTKIEIPNSVQSIESTAFSNSLNLKEIIIHKPAGSISGSPWGCIYGERAIKWTNE